MLNITPKNSNKKVSLLSAGCLALGSAIFLFTLLRENAFYIPNSISQFIAVIFMGCSIYINVGYVMKEYTFATELTAESENSIPDFLIYEKKNQKLITVCRVGLDRITYIGVIDSDNKKDALQNRRHMRRYKYNSIFLQKKFTEIRFCDGDENASVLITYDENFHNNLQREAEIYSGYNLQ